MNNFSIQHQITLKEYTRLNFALLYGKIWFLTLSALGALFVMWSLLLCFVNHYSIFNNEYSTFGATAAILSVYVPVINWLRCFRIFRSNFKLSEPLTYDFSEEGLAITGESFSSKYGWEKIPRIKTIKGWLLVYQGRAITNLLKTESADHANIDSLKIFLKERYPQIKVK